MQTPDTNLVTPAVAARARRRLLDMHFDSRVGHIGGNLSAIDALLVVFHEMLGPQDHFILSKGHSAGALYVAMWSAGRLQDQELDGFHKDGTLLAGHPPASGIPGIEFATGSLGHGLSLAAGTALGKRLRGANGRVICLTSDGEWQEGSTWEALIFACHHRLASLTVLVDHNELQGFGGTGEVASMNPLWARLAGFDAQLEVIDGHDLRAIRSALRAPRDQLTVVVLRTTKGRGVRSLEGRLESHYLPLDGQQHAAAISDLDGAS